MSETPHPAACGADKITFQDLYNAVREEKERAEITAKSMGQRAGEATDKAERADWIAANRRYLRRALVLEKVLTMIDRCSTDGVLLDRLAEMNRAELRAAAEGDMG